MMPETRSGPGFEIPDQVLVAHLQDEAVLLHLGTKRYFRLNETGAWIWKGLERGLDRDALVEHLRTRFAVDPTRAREALAAHLAQLEHQQLLVVKVHAE